MRHICACKHSRCILIALMSFFVMGFQFMPGGLDLRDKLALKHYAQALPVKGAVSETGSTEKKSWFAIPKVDFGLDALYGLDKPTHEADSDDLQF